MPQLTECIRYGLNIFKKYGKPASLVLFCVLVFILSHRYRLDNHVTDPANLAILRAMIDENYLKASLIYIICMSICCVILSLPGVAFAVIGGLLFGPVMGTLLCLIAATIGAVLSFIAGRYFLKDSVRPMLEKYPVIKKLLFDNANNSALFLLLVTRLLPIFPYNIQNFAYGITDIGLIQYAIYTFIFMAPGVAIFTIGTAGLWSNENRMFLFCWSGSLALLVIISGILLYRRYVK
ncbi:MAG: VTT domain-containing protein [Candidatus Cloacimonetes bacterium]|jgi:uncharacterized membrane protein YdjX (TVP38/TMEM64 family)|nr:VTT domain-containing protein [Candidatus Cloacimonadota bacterium]